MRFVRRPEMVLAVGVFSYFVLAAYQLSLVLPGVLLLAGIVSSLRVLGRLGPDPAELPTVSVLALAIALPVTRVPHDRILLYATEAATAAITSCAVRAGQGPRRAARGTYLVLGVFAVLAVVSVYSPDAGALKSLATVGVPGIAAFVLGGTLSEGSMRRVVRVVVVLALLESLFALLELAGITGHIWATPQLIVNGSPIPLQNSLLPGGSTRSQGTFGSPLPLGVLLLVALALLARIPARRRGSVRLVPAAVLIAGLVATGDRSCLIGAVLVLLFWQRIGVVRAATFLVLGLLGVTLLAASGVLDASVLQNFFGSGDFLHRLSAVTSVQKLVDGQNLPQIFLGNGFSSTQRMFDRGLLQTDGFNVVDDQIVLLLSQGGLVAVGLFVALLLAAVRRARSWLRLGVVAVVAVQFVFDALTWPSTAVVVLLVLGAALGRRTPHPSEHPESRPILWKTAGSSRAMPAGPAIPAGFAIRRSVAPWTE